mmetsp:Transcript_22654/g.47285  ORF Transcript_22654/g.47285 Transcript_22654/m.47285 type:complete len:282 (-) Transcript_22654:452-1297(-)
MQRRSNHRGRMLLLVVVVDVPAPVIVAIDAKRHPAQQLHGEMPRAPPLQLREAHVAGRTGHLPDQVRIAPHRRIVPIVHEAPVPKHPGRRGVLEARPGLPRDFRGAVQRERVRRASPREHVPQRRLPIQKEVRTRHALGRTDRGSDAAARAGTARRAPGVVGESRARRAHEFFVGAGGGVVDVVEGGVEAEGGVGSAPERVLGVVLGVDSTLLFIRRFRIAAAAFSIRTDNGSRIHRHEPSVQCTLFGQIRAQGSIVKEPKRRTPRLIHRIRSRRNIGKAR